MFFSRKIALVEGNFLGGDDDCLLMSGWVFRSVLRGFFCSGSFGVCKCFSFGMMRTVFLSGEFSLDMRRFFVTEFFGVCKGVLG